MTKSRVICEVLEILANLTHGSVICEDAQSSLLLSAGGLK